MLCKLVATIGRQGHHALEIHQHILDDVVASLGRDGAESLILEC